MLTCLVSYLDLDVSQPHTYTDTSSCAEHTIHHATQSDVGVFWFAEPSHAADFTAAVATHAPHHTSAPFSRDLSHSAALRITGLHPHVSLEEVSSMLNDVLFDYHVPESNVCVKLGRGARSHAGFATVQCRDPVDALRVVNDIDGVEIGSCVFKVTLLAPRVAKTINQEVLGPLLRSHKA